MILYMLKYTGYKSFLHNKKIVNVTVISLSYCVSRIRVVLLFNKVIQY